MRDELTRLNSMPPEQRQRWIARTEAMERLSMPQRQQVRNAYAQLGGLPEDRRIAISRTFHMLQGMPEEQRQLYLNSPQYHTQFSDEERLTLYNLMVVSPLLPSGQR